MEVPTWKVCKTTTQKNVKRRRLSRPDVATSQGVAETHQSPLSRGYAVRGVEEEPPKAPSGDKDNTPSERVCPR